jgi:hypothetical protein
MKRCLISLILREREDIVVRVGDGEFGGAVKCLLKPVDDVHFFLDAVEEAADLSDPDIEEQGAAVLAADHGEGVAEALEGLEHKGNVAAGDHGPVEVAVGFGGDGHNEIKAKGLIEFDGSPDVFDEEIGRKGVHVVMFNWLKKYFFEFTNFISKLAKLS